MKQSKQANPQDKEPAANPQSDRCTANDKAERMKRAQQLQEAAAATNDQG